MNTRPIHNDRRIAITGASGYLGRNLCRYFNERGAEVFQLSSNPAKADTSIPAAHFSFAAGVAKGFFAENKINSLIHAAYDFGPRTRADIWECNVKGSINLFEQARAEGVERIVFVSSMSAYHECQSLYGQAKLEIENEFRSMQLGCSVRPGLIYSTPLTESGGMVGSLLKSIQRGTIPMVGAGDQQLYLSHESDLGSLMGQLLQDERAMSGPPIVAANSRPYALREIVQLLSETMNAKQPRIVPVPWKLAWAGLRMLEVVKLNPEFRSDSIVSLVHQNPNPDFSNIPDGIIFRDFAATIRARGDSC